MPTQITVNTSKTIASRHIFCFLDDCSCRCVKTYLLFSLNGFCTVCSVVLSKSSDPIHTVCFDWFLSGLEWIVNLYLKLLIFYQKLLWSIRSRLNSSTFWVFRPLFRYLWWNLSFSTKNEDFDQTYSYNSIKRTCSIKRPGLEFFKKTLLNVPYHH
jgi:hypothetical protein